MTNDDAVELACFERGEFNPAQFPHSEHVRIAFEFLRRERFADALARFARGLRGMAERAGRPEAYHETITIAFASLIAERMLDGSGQDFAAFKDANPDLFDRHVLLKIYSRDRLHSAAARRTFLLPDAA